MTQAAPADHFGDTGGHQWNNGHQPQSTGGWHYRLPGGAGVGSHRAVDHRPCQRDESHRRFCRGMAFFAALTIALNGHDPG